jgi:hypothetical protein
VNSEYFLKKMLAVLLMIGLGMFFLPGQSYQKMGVSSDDELEKEIKELSRKIEEFKRTLKLPADAVPMTFIRTFPGNFFEDSEVFLSSGKAIALDGDNHLYVSDVQYDRILTFDLKGNFLKQIGRNGQGPGDLYRAYSLMIHDNRLVVYENGNNRIQYMDLLGNYRKSFKVFKAYFDVEIDGDGYMYATPPGLRDVRKDKLIDKYNEDGRIVNSFGDPYWDHPLYNEGRIEISEKGDIIFAFIKFPIMRKYAPSGKLLKEKRIDDPRLDFFEKFNIDYSKNKVRRSRGYGRAFILNQGLAIGGDRIYMYTNSDPIEILEFDMDLIRHNT